MTVVITASSDGKRMASFAARALEGAVGVVEDQLQNRLVDRHRRHRHIGRAPIVEEIDIRAPTATVVEPAQSSQRPTVSAERERGGHPRGETRVGVSADVEAGVTKAGRARRVAHGHAAHQGGEEAALVGAGYAPPRIGRARVAGERRDAAPCEDRVTRDALVEARARQTGMGGGTAQSASAGEFGEEAIERGRRSDAGHGKRSRRKSY